MSRQPRYADRSSLLTRWRLRPSRLLLVGALAGAVLGTAGAVVATRAVASSADHCDRDVAPVRVVVAPELSYPLSASLQRAAARGALCLNSAQVVPSDPAKTAASLRSGVASADVWIPDSSAWLDAVRSKLPAVAGDPQPIATSPLVLAVPTALAGTAGHRTTTLDALLPARGQSAGPARWVLPSPDRSAATVGAILALRAAVRDRPDASTVLSTVIRASSQEPVTAEDAAGSPGPLVTPMSEQQTYAYNADHPEHRLTGIYPAVDPFVFDYPLTVLSDDDGQRPTIAAIVAALHDDRTRQLLDQAGFRTPTGSVGNEQASPDKRTLAYVPTARTLADARDAYRAVLEPSRLLALIDVSGSMAKKVPGAGGATRLGLATQAAVNGLAVYPDDTAVGLWVFATDLTRTTDYRQLAPVAPLGRGADGVSGRERVALGLAKVRVARGHWTGLYDSVLAAVREQRRTWDPERVNSVVVITDGGNSDKHGISLDRLLQTLRRENDPARPVAVYAIAYGPSGDLPTLRRISAATGGKAYAAPNPRMINEVLRDAVGRRACSPRC